jgi:integrase
MTKVASGDTRDGNARRANGTGSIHKRPDGSLDVRVSLAGGRRRRKLVQRLPGETAAQQRRRAEHVAETMREDGRRGHVLPSGHITVESFSQAWLSREREKSRAGRGLAPATVDFYRQAFEYYVNPLIGSRPLPELTTGDVEFMMSELSRRGRSPRTVQAARNALGRLLKSAKQEGLVSHLATADASQVRRTLADDDLGPESKALSADQVGRLLDAASGTAWEPLIALLGLLGLRRGEALALTWTDVDLESGIVRVRRSLNRIRERGQTRLELGPTKTKGSRRQLHIPDVLAAQLRSWRAEQNRQRLRVGEHWGSGWVDEDLVFTTPLGTPVDPDNLRHALSRLAKTAGIGHVHPHQLRHSMASILIASGHTPPEVSRLLGHSSPSVTLNFYAHAFEEAQVRAVDTVAAAVQARRS